MLVALGSLGVLVGCQTASSFRKDNPPARDPVAAAAMPTPAPAPQPAPVSDRVATPKPPDRGLEDGAAAFKAGKYAEARAAFKGVVRQHPENVTARLNLALAEEHLGLGGRGLDEAIVRTEEALRAPGQAYDVTLLNNLAVAYRAKKRYPEAEAAARKLLSRTTDNAEAYKNLALVYYEEGRYRLAELVNANARKMDDQDPGLLNNLGMIYLKTEQQPRALAEFKKALALDPSFVPAYVNLGSMALAYRDYAGAERAFTKVVELAPTRADGHLLRAYALEGQKVQNPKKGLEAGVEFEKVLALEPPTPEAICGAGWAYSVERSGWERATRFLSACKALPSSGPQDRQSIDAKLASLEAQQRATVAAPVKPGVGGLAAPSAGANPAVTPPRKTEPASKLSGSSGK